MPLPISNERWSGPRLDAAQAPPPPPEPTPSLLESIPAAVRSSFDAVPFTQNRRVGDAYLSLADALDEVEGQHDLIRLQTGNGALFGQDKRDAVWKRLQDLRARGVPLPKSLAALPKDRTAFEAAAITRDGAYAKDAQLAARGGAGVQFIGGAISSFGDPENLIGGAMAGAALKAAALPVLRGMLVEGAVNAALEVGQAPANSDARVKLGEKPMTASDIAMGAAEAFVFGAAVHGVARGAHAGFERAVAANWERLPQGLRTRWEARATLDPAGEDKLIADLSSALIGRENMSEAERGAADALARNAAIEGSNPFLPNGQGTQAHLDLLGQRMADIIAGTAGEKPSFVPPDAGGPVPQLGRGDTALATGTVAGDAQSRFMARVRRAESSGNDAAAAATSTAFGRYQFTAGTWIGYYTRRFGTGGLTRAEILAKRADPRLQDALMADLTADNAAHLQRIGAPVTEGNLYLMHLLGPADAEKVLRAGGDTPLKGLIHDASITANRSIMEGRTAGDIRAFADRKMGGSGSDGGGLHLNPAAATDMEAGLRAQIDAELAQVRAETARLEAEMRARGMDPEQIVADAFPEDAHPVPVEPTDADGAPVPLAEPVKPVEATARPDLPAEAQDTVSRVRAMVAEPGRDLNDLDAIAKELGVTAPEVRTALLELVKEKGGGVRVRRKDGAFVRARSITDRIRSKGPLDVLDFIASVGGLRDDEGHNLGLKTLSPKEIGPDGMISEAAKNRARRARSGGGRNWKHMGAFGPLLRHSGRSVDQIGELLHEAGYLNGAEGGRPTTAEVLAFIDQRFNDGKKRYTREDAAQMGEAPPDPSAILAESDQGDAPSPVSLFARQQFEAIAEAWGMAPDLLDDELLSYAYDIAHTLPEFLHWDDALAKAINDIADATRWAAVDETGDIQYEDLDYEWPHTSENPAPGGEAGAAAGDSGRPARDGGNPTAGGQERANDGSAAEGPPRLEDLPREETTRFLDPEGDSAARQADTLEHDARAAEAVAEDIPVANADGEITPQWEQHLTNAEARAAVIEQSGRQALFHATAGMWEPANPNGLGMTFWAENVMDAARYAGAGGGRRVVGKAGRILVEAAPASAKLLDITTQEGLAVLASLPEKGRISKIIVQDAKRDLTIGGANATNSLWSFTKRITGSDAEGIRRHIVDELRSRGYEGIRFQDDTHTTIAVFDGSPEGGSRGASLDNGAAVDPNLQAKARQENDLAAQQPLSGARKTGKAQDPTLPEGLFGGPIEPTFDLGDGSPPKSMKDLLADIDRDTADNATIENCMIPGPKGNA
ncbi:hypothetical protein [Novosphingobium huizhouense]|uniref:hypothetical protein n=1 Tax=Novosphingobium huizhouense TaxID=2866625 RepID=UPI001CD8F199|nr:hypothetical protein [Novosphingobium huizhouense]